jgi:hypothetical protein
MLLNPGEHGVGRRTALARVSQVIFGLARVAWEICVRSRLERTVTNEIPSAWSQE